jgi:hypothetical protein
MAEILGLSKLVAQLREMAAKSVKDDNCSVSVGFQTEYAIYVHEDLQAHHPTGQAKFLEQPARQLSSDGTFANIIRQAKQSDKTMAQSLLLAGLRLQRDSQALCPVLTGNLRASAFTRVNES